MNRRDAARRAAHIAAGWIDGVLADDPILTDTNGEPLPERDADKVAEALRRIVDRLDAR